MKPAPALLGLLLSVHPALAQPVATSSPAVPLITFDPYISAWSMRDKLTDDWPRHWSGAVMGMAGLVWVDGTCYRWCGPAGAAPEGVKVARQQGVSVATTRTEYKFEAGPVGLSVEFVTPMGMADDMARVSRSVSVVGFRAVANDQQPHEVRIYLDVTGEWCTQDSSDSVAWSRHRVAGGDVLRMGRTEQPVLEHAGDQRKIDWGYVYLAGGAETAAGGHHASRAHFAKTGHTLDSDDLRTPRAAGDDWPILAVVADLGKLIPGEQAAGRIFVGYDEGAAIELFGRKLEPLWRAGGWKSFADQLAAVRAELAKGDVFEAAEAKANKEFCQQAERVGGRRYADLLSLAYRQVLAGHKIVADWDGTPLMFSKENTSNGCIATVDVIYPACPFFLYHNPAMLTAQLRPLMQYASSPRWKFPFAPHDLGTYPKANGQVYGGGERTEDDQMPVEESGNMLIMLAALAKVDPKEGLTLCQPYWPTLEKWANYLKQHGLDPANQLCTDDFAGHLARNSNLSAKTVVALAAYAQLLGAAGKEAESKQWGATAEDFAQRWSELNKADAPDNASTPLVFGDKGKNTWSQKYNLVWDRALGLKLFPPAVYEREMALYRTKQNKYGLPLDSRRAYTKLDWTAWTACLTGKREDFDAIMSPVLDWANASPPPSRVPLSDWYDTVNGKSEGFAARTVVGGLWMPLLIDKLKSSK